MFVIEMLHILNYDFAKVGPKLSKLFVDKKNYLDDSSDIKAERSEVKPMSGVRDRDLYGSMRRSRAGIEKSKKQVLNIYGCGPYYRCEDQKKNL